MWSSVGQSQGCGPIRGHKLQPSFEFLLNSQITCTLEEAAFQKAKQPTTLVFRDNTHQAAHCLEFAGEPHGGYISWFHWNDSVTKTGV